MGAERQSQNPQPAPQRLPVGAGAHAATVAAMAALLLLAAILRLGGIHWGLPNPSHSNYSYHPDESLSVLGAGLLARGQLVPKQFEYGGTLHYSMLNAYYRYGQLLAPVLGGSNPMANTLLFGRYFVVAGSLLTIIVGYLTGRQLFGDAAGMLAAAFLAVSPAHVFLAQNVRPDEFGTLLITLLLYLSVLILRRKDGRDLRRFALAGLILGIIGALRLPLVVMGAAPPLAFALRRSGFSGRATASMLLGRCIPILAAAAAVGYAVASPYSLLHLDWLLQGFQVQKAYQAGVFADAAERGPGIYQYGSLMLRQALGTPLYALAVAGIVRACIRPSPARVLLLACTAVYFTLLLFISWVVVRYTLPLLPMLVLLAADCVTSCAGGRLTHYVSGAVAAGVIGWTLLADAAFLNVQAGTNVRDRTTDWMRQHLAHRTTLIEVQQYDGDVFLNPVLPEGYPQRKFVLGTDSVQRLIPVAEHQCLVLSGAVYRDMERLGARNPQRGVYALQQALESRYRMVVEVEVPVRLLGIDFSDDFTSQDYQIVNPGERVYCLEPEQDSRPRTPQ